MQTPIRSISLGFLIAVSAMPVRAQSSPPRADPPLTLSLPKQSAPLELSISQAVTAPSDTIVSPLQSASDEIQRVARWVNESHDNLGLPYLLVDKVNARVFAFNPAGQLQGTAPALLGMARGDRLKASNDAQMTSMPPQVRVTPAGRFVSRLAIDSLGKELLVLDYDAAISLHAVIKGTPAEHRAERLNSPTAQDNRISYGCINVPEAFYASIISPSFAKTRGIVYVLPETGPASALFGLAPMGAVVSGTAQGSPAVSSPATQKLPAPDAR